MGSGTGVATLSHRVHSLAHGNRKTAHPSLPGARLCNPAPFYMPPSGMQARVPAASTPGSLLLPPGLEAAPSVTVVLDDDDGDDDDNAAASRTDGQVGLWMGDRDNTRGTEWRLDVHIVC